MPINRIRTASNKSLQIILHLVLLWPSALWLAWIVLSQANFLYPLDYRLLTIPETIEKYVPQNRYGKENFIETNVKEHIRLFAAITHAVNHNGHGLSELHYFAPDGRDLGVFLTHDEVTHLTDVSHVVEIGKDVGKITFMAWLILIGLGFWRKKALPGLLSFATGTAATVFIVTATVFVVGPMRVFGDFHRSVFPANHPWFFYYQDSLMTTFMQAPNLFGLIALWWLILTCLFLLMLWSLASRLMTWRVLRKDNPAPKKS